MIADPRTSFEPHSSEQLPASKKIYVEGTLNPDVRVPMREIAVTDTELRPGSPHGTPGAVFTVRFPLGSEDAEG